MRVITGSAKGRRLKAIKNTSIRPTSDKVKGAIFNILGNAIIDADILDLFSGTGALGIEALSRGARSAVFVENEFRCLKIIQDNLYLCSLSGETIKGDVYKIVERLGKNSFNIVFADPPYGKDLARNLLSHLDKFSILKNFAFIIIEHSKKDILEEPVQFSKIKENRYGDTVVSIYKYTKGPKA